MATYNAWTRDSQELKHQSFAINCGRTTKRKKEIEAIGLVARDENLWWQRPLTNTKQQLSDNGPKPDVETLADRIQMQKSQLAN